jgi:hypothetical protein
MVVKKSRIHLKSLTDISQRIVDLSTTICEDAIYLTEGKVIKYHQQ